MAVQRAQRGFGLLEVILASGVLAMVVGAAVGLVRSSLRRTTIGLERSVAMNLAQEPIEQLRSIRDSVYIDGINNTWADSWPSSTQTDCQQLTTQCPVFRVTSKSGGGWQVQPGAEPPIGVNGQEFHREVYITTPKDYALNAGTGSTNDAELVRKLHVIVRWECDSQGVCVQAVESATYLTNWRTGI